MTSRPVRRKRNAGISLLEIMVVLAIIALVVGLAAPRLMGNFGRAKTMVAEAQMENVKGALQLYYIDLGRYPSEAEGLKALLSAPTGAKGWRGPYMDKEEDISDPWGRILLYRSPGTDKAFDLVTYGRDGHPGGENEDGDLSM
ncbi:type II secretion system major pseudopilin GspG [Parasedimentitalea huanghaiensis]|uniref:Type II secretion system core protein G n=1 Tax=Parasedimentitalea huanghaiensis TaxID=2682100 RepID=A0A6L6WMM1_9RHOB|nr:type II secretion system major pseudopilin GspG [Zongyanglinia huanghaiensis]MVO18478.1 type II secretion system protein GspG [Zongyanglinia huanghaiensis]